MTKYKLPYILIFCIFWGCVSSEKKDDAIQRIVIDFDHTQVLSLSDIVEKIEYVKLETTDANLLGTVGKTFVFDHDLFVVGSLDPLTVSRDRFIVSRFDRTGKFLNHIGKIGGGPGELFNARQVCINEDCIEILSSIQNSTVYRFDYKGNLLETDKIEGIQSFDFSPIDGRTRYLYGAEPQPPYHRLWQTEGSKCLQKIERLPHKDIFSGNLDQCFFKTSDKILFLEQFNDTVYCLDKAGCTPYLFFDFGKKQIPNHLFDGCRDLYEMMKVSYMKQPPQFAEVLQIWENRSLIIAQITDFETPLFTFLRDKVKRKEYLLNMRGGVRNDMAGHPLGPLVSVTDREIVFALDAFEALEMPQTNNIGNRQTKNEWDLLKSQLTENSNPVLIICHLK